MNRKHVLLNTTLFAATFFTTVLVLAICNTENNIYLRTRTDFEPFSMTISAFDENKSEEVKYTNRGNPISFSHSGYAYVENNWGLVADTGYFKNDTMINGLQSITIDFVTTGVDLNVSYGWFNEDYVVTSGILNSDHQTYNFNDEQPSYFLIENNSGTDITINSVSLIYSCSETSLPDSYSQGEYQYSVNGNEVRLTKYIGSYKTLVVVPTQIEGKRVTSIAEGCFTTNEVQTRAITRAAEEEEKDYSTYYIDESIDEIEEGAFDPKSSFVTNAEDKNEGWNDSALSGSAKADEGNVYYNTAKKETITRGGIVYVYDPQQMAYYVARCLTQRKDVEIPAYVDGYSVVYIGRQAFYSNNHIKSVTLPSTIGQIRYGAFSDCKKLSEVNLDECENLGDIKGYSFYNCTSLDIFRMPCNCKSAMSYSFSYCGVISEFYMPGSVNSIYASAFYNTTIKTLFYGGTRERFETNVLKNHNRDMFENTEVVCEGETRFIPVDSLEEVEDLPNEVQTRITGVLSGYYNYYTNNGFRTIMVTDPDTNYTVNCYFHQGAPFDDNSYIGRTVEVTGIKSSYIGHFELVECEIELKDDDPVELHPTVIDYNDPNYNPNDYLNHYCVLSDTIADVNKGTTFFVGAHPLVAYSRNYKDVPSELLTIGNPLTLKGWIIMYNQTIEIVYDGRMVASWN